MRIATHLSQHTHLTRFPNTREAIRIASLLALVASMLVACGPLIETSEAPVAFSGEQAFGLVIEQLEFGPRIPGSAASIQAGDWILDGLELSGWEVEAQTFASRDIPLRNLVARSSAEPSPLILLGTHYDTRPVADRDKTAPHLPVPGAQDGASGTAVLLELARVLDRRALRNSVWLVFFDAEDSGGINDWDWAVGSRHFASTMRARPAAVVIVDMVGDADLQLYFEGASDPALAASIWSVAKDMQYGGFIPEVGRTILDDHVPFLQMGIPAVLLIDIDYPYWHTTEDTADKVSPASLEQVGRVLQVWLEQTEIPATPLP